MAFTKKYTDGNFTIIGNEVIMDMAVDYRAKGLLLVMWSKQEGWNFSIKGLASLTNNDGETAVRTALNNLKETGYLRVDRIIDERGRVVDWRYNIADRPIFKEENNSCGGPSGGSHPKNRTVKINTSCSDHKKPHVDIPDLENTRINKISKDKKTKDKSCSFSRSCDHSLVDVKKDGDEDMTDMTDRKSVENAIKENIGYQTLTARYSLPKGHAERPFGNIAMLDEVVNIMVDTLCTRGSLVRLGKNNTQPLETVRSQFMKLRQPHIERLLSSLSMSKKKLTAPKEYIKVALYNSSFTGSISRYSSEMYDTQKPSFDLDAFERYAQSLDLSSLKLGSRKTDAVCL